MTKNKNKNKVRVPGKPKKEAEVVVKQRRRRVRGGQVRPEAPASFGMRGLNRPARFGGNGQVIVVAHKEYVGDVRGSVGFQAVGYPVNPGQSTLFPWLSVIAANYEKYRFRKLRFDYESSVSTFLSGLTELAVDLDASDAAPTSKQQMMSYMHATRSNIWAPSNMTTPEQQPELYVRTGPVPPNNDVKTYDAGNLFVATSGCADDSVVGELYVEYEVELHVPQLSSTGGVSLEVHSAFGSETGVWDLTGMTWTGSLQVQTTSSTRIFIPSQIGQTFLVVVHADGSSITGAPTIAAPSVSGSTGSSVFFGIGATGATGTTMVRALTCNTVTDNTFGAGAGYFVLDITAPVGTITDSQIGITPFQTPPLPPQSFSVVSELQSLRGLVTALSERLALIDSDRQSVSDSN